MNIDIINISLEDQLQSTAESLRKTKVDLSEIEHLKAKVKQTFSVMQSKFEDILFQKQEVSFEFFKHKAIELFILSENEATLLSVYFFQKTEQSEETFEVDKKLSNLVLKERLMEFAGEVNIEKSNLFEELKYSLCVYEESVSSLAHHLISLSKWSVIPPLDILSCFALHKIDINPFNIISFLCEESSSMMNISKEAVEKLADIVQSNSSKKLGDSLRRHTKNSRSMKAIASGKALQMRLPSFDDIADRSQQMIIRIADFIFEHNTSLFKLIHNYVFSKVIDGHEFQLIKYEHFYHVMESCGFVFSYIDRWCVESLVKPIFGDNFDIEGLRYYLKV